MRIGCSDVEASNAAIEALLQAEHARATRLIDTHRGALLALVDGYARLTDRCPTGAA